MGFMSEFAQKHPKAAEWFRKGGLQEAILTAINSAMSRKETLISQITSAMRMELAPVPGETMSAADIDRRLSKLNEEFQELFATSKGEGGYLMHADKFKRIADDMAALKEKKDALLEQQNSNSAVGRRIQDAVRILENGSADIIEWDESMIRQLVDTVKVLSADRIKVYLHGGIEIEQAIREGR